MTVLLLHSIAPPYRRAHHPNVASSNGAVHLSSLQTPSANPNALDGSVDIRTYDLNVGNPTALVQDVRVADGVTGLRLFPTDFATPCHFPHLLRRHIAFVL